MSTKVVRRLSSGSLSLHWCKLHYQNAGFFFTEKKGFVAKLRHTSSVSFARLLRNDNGLMSSAKCCYTIEQFENKSKV